jgi:hypothetical protein
VLQYTPAGSHSGWASEILTLTLHHGRALGLETQGRLQEIPDVQRFEAGQVLGTPDGQPAPYYGIAELWFDSPEATFIEPRSSRAR